MPSPVSAPPRLHVEAATPDFLADVAASLEGSNRLTMGVSRESARDLYDNANASSPRAYAIVEHEHAIGAFGVLRIPNLGPATGFAWLTITPRLRFLGFEFARGSRRVVDLLFHRDAPEPFDLLVSWIPAAAQCELRYARFLGFRIGRTFHLGPHSIPYHELLATP